MGLTMGTGPFGKHPAGTFNFGLNATYVNKYEYQNEQGGEWIQNVGVFSGVGPVFRLQSSATANWNLGPWGLGIINHYKSHYVDEVPTNVVASWSVWDMFGTWQPTKAVMLTAGVRNLADKAPPFSNQSQTFQVGYDPRFTDATGRTYYVRGTYNF